MFYDNALLLSSAQAITTTAASSNLYDVTGAGSGNAPAMICGQTKFGADISASDGPARPSAVFTVTTNGTGTGTIAIAVQAAPDDGSDSPGTYVTLSQTEAYVGTTLDVGDVIVLPIPPYNKIKGAMGKPRFYRFYYTQTGDGAVSLTGAILLNPATGYEGTQYSNNFVSA